MLNVLLTWFALWGAAVPAPAGRITYWIDGSRSRIVVQTRTDGPEPSARHDHFLETQAMTGTISFIPYAPDTATLELKVRADQLRLTDPGVSDKDRRAIEGWIRRALGADRHREIVFRSTGVTASPLGDGIFDVALTGDLRIRGQTRPLRIDGQLFARPDELSVEGNTPIVQSQFDVPLAAVDGSATMVRDEVTVTFQIRAARHD